MLDKRYIRYDNSLVISAFKPHDYEQEIHSTVYKCQASNMLGSIVSRDVVINAGKCKFFTFVDRQRAKVFLDTFWEVR